MSVDFSKLIATPQGNTVHQKPADQQAVATPVAQVTPAAPSTQAASTPVVQQQLTKDTFTPQTPKTSEPVSFLDKALKYSGVVALVATPIAVIATHKFGNNGNDKVLKDLTNSVADIAKKIEDSTVFQKTIQEAQEGIKTAQNELKSQVTDVTKKVVELAGTVAGATLILNSIGNVKGGAKNQFKKSQEISPATIEILETEATKRINGEFQWPKIDNINAWMVTAETESFLSTGGLGQVAVQLPDAFNKKFEGDKENNIDIITPLYVSQNKDKNNKDIPEDKKQSFITKVNEKEYLYTGGGNKPNKINLKVVDSFKVKVYNPATASFKNEEVEILEGTYTSPATKATSKYTFIKNDKYFNIDPGANNPTGREKMYVTNVNNIDEEERMMFLSKASYEYLKRVKEGTVKDQQAPNILLANDWHAAAMAPLMRYKAPVDADKKAMSKETYDYIKNVPIIHITHNAKLEGVENDAKIADKIVRTLFEEDTDEISPKLRAYNEEGWPLSNGEGTYNSAKADVYLADRIVPVSNNYAKEITKSKDLTNNEETRMANKARDEHNTMIGIVNGYDKDRLRPNQNVMGKINDAFRTSLEYKPYDNLSGDQAYEAKQHNKKATFVALNELANRARSNELIIKNLKNPEKDDVKLYKADSCELPADLDINKVPFISSVGRFVEQKGFDYMVKGLTNIINNTKPGQEYPVVAILGSGDEEFIKPIKAFKDELLKTNPEAAKRIFIFTGFNNDMREAFGTGSDFFALPSKWEPCGLTQMECMSKGSIPIATSTGGLPDTIYDGKDGFLTDEFFGFASNEPIYPSEADVKSGKLRNNNKSLLKVRDNIDSYTVALSRAFETFYTNHDKIREMSVNAMERDFSWNLPNGPLDQYIELMKTGTVKRDTEATK